MDSNHTGRKTIIKIIQFLFDSLKAICICFGFLQNEKRQISKPLRRRKKVQLCETRVNADASKASYAKSVIVLILL